MRKHTLFILAFILCYSCKSINTSCYSQIAKNEFLNSLFEMPMTSTYVDLQKYIATDSLQFDDWFDDLYTCFNDSLQGSRIEGKIIFIPDITIHTISVLVYPGSVKGAHKTFLELQDYYKNYLGAWLDDTDYEEPGIKSCIWKKYNFSLFLREEWSMSYVNIYRRK